MDDKGDVDRIDDVILPGFRFHPTDEELVGFYLKRKIQQRSLPIELIKQVDIYKYDPWDLPQLASSGEKEWYFFCPRDRKYRNSARPNRVTGAGFWKATGTDRPIYSSDGTKCIGLKKSLVFYRGRAAKGLKTDWMMHEFRLPTATTNNESAAAAAAPPKKLLSDKSLPLHDAWAICRIFKKTNSLAQRALSHAWMAASLPETSPDLFQQGVQYAQYSSENISCTTTEPLNDSATFSALNIPSCKPLINGSFFKPPFGSNPNGDHLANNFMDVLFNPAALLGDSTCKPSESIDFEGMSMENDETGGLRKDQREDSDGSNQWGDMRSMGFPFSLQNLPWDSPPECPSEISTTYSNKCYT